MPPPQDKQLSSGKNRNKPQLTFSCLVDGQVRHSLDGLPDSVLGDAREVAAVAPIADRVDAQHRAMRHLVDEVALATVTDAAPALAPVDIRGGVARSLAEEADGLLVQNLLVLRGERDTWGIWNIMWDMVKGCA